MVVYATFYFKIRASGIFRKKFLWSEGEEVSLKKKV